MRGGVHTISHVGGGRETFRLAGTTWHCGGRGRIGLERRARVRRSAAVIVARNRVAYLFDSEAPRCAMPMGCW